MIDFSDALIIDHYKRLPADLKSRLFNEDTSTAIFAICSKLHLSLDQMNACADEVDLFLLGMTVPEDFPKKLSARTELGPDITNQVVSELAIKLFSPIKEALKTVHRSTDIVFPKLIPPQAPNKVMEKGMVAATAPVNKTTPPTISKELQTQKKAEPAPAAPIQPQKTLTTQLFTEKNTPVVSDIKKTPPIAKPVPATGETLRTTPPRTISISIEKNKKAEEPQPVAPIEAKSAAPTIPPPPPPKSVIAAQIIEEKPAVKEKEQLPPHKAESAPVAAAATSPITKTAKPLSQNTPSPFIDPIPKKAIESAATPSVLTRRPLNWSDVLASQHKESNEPGVVLSKLERALNSGSPTASTQAPVAPASYQGKDPYREPIE